MQNESGEKPVKDPNYRTKSRKSLSFRALNHYDIACIVMHLPF